MNDPCFKFAWFTLFSMNAMTICSFTKNMPYTKSILPPGTFPCKDQMLSCTNHYKNIIIDSHAKSVKSIIPWTL